MKLEHLVTDVNGTLAVDGQLIEGIPQKIAGLKDRLTVHMLTADTHGKQASIDQQLNLTAIRIETGNESQQKADYVRQLGSESVIALGQGANDAGRLKEAGIGICVLSLEGTTSETLSVADLVTPDVNTAFDLLSNPLRMVASLRK